MDDYESKNKTFYFLGTVELEAPVGGPVRRKLKQAIENKTGVTFIKTVRLNAKLQAESYGRNIQQWMRQSKFCIVPHGDSPSSKRLIDTIQSLCVPVILSDPIRFPFEEVFIDYQKIVIQIPMWSPETLIPVVEKFNRKEEILSRMKAMKNVRRNFDVNIFHQLEKRDQAWMWIWLHYIKICTVKSMMRRELLPSAYDI